MPGLAISKFTHLEASTYQSETKVLLALERALRAAEVALSAQAWIQGGIAYANSGMCASCCIRYLTLGFRASLNFLCARLECRKKRYRAEQTRQTLEQTLKLVSLKEMLVIISVAVIHYPGRVTCFVSLLQLLCCLCQALFCVQA